jgi:hypothetical protein
VAGPSVRTRRDQPLPPDQAWKGPGPQRSSDGAVSLAAASCFMTPWADLGFS